MKTLRCFGVAALLLGASMPGLSMMELADISPEQAKKLGVEIRSHSNGESGVAVTVEFKAEGELKNFSRVDLRLRADAKTLVDASLQTTKETGDVIQARFSADPALLAQGELTLVVTNGARTFVGYRFKVGEFVGSKP